MPAASTRHIEVLLVFAAPINTVAPAVTGTTGLGDTLTSTDGTWTDDGSPAFTYQWARDGVNIGGATAATRVIAAADQGHSLTCTVTNTDTHGATSAVSNSVVVPGAVSAALPFPGTGALVAATL